MGCENVEVILEPPEPMMEAEVRHWESINRPANMLWLKKLEPIGEEPTAKWKAEYEECDDVTAGLCS